MSALKNTITALLALTLATGPAMARDKSHKREVYKRGQIFQNVAAEDVRPLLKNTAWIGHWWDDETKDKGGYVRIAWYGADGREHSCLTDAKGETDGWLAATYTGYTKDLPSQKLRYPLEKHVYDHTGKPLYLLLRYNGETGALNTFTAASRRWWESDVGHLQARIPAVTWENCPKFPSAESLGAEINEKQTSRFYYELLEQDPGQRILRPQYVNENAHEWYGKEQVQD